MQGSIASRAFLSPCSQEHDGSWWRSLGSSCAATLLHPVLVLAARRGRAAFGVGLPALRAVLCRGVRWDGAGEGAARLCSIFPCIPPPFSHALVPAVPECLAPFLPTRYLPAWLQTLQLPKQ